MLGGWLVRSICALTLASIFVAPSRAEDCGLSAAEVYERAESSIVEVFALSIDPFAAENRVRGSIGSGAVIEGGLILTNYHTIHDQRALTVTIQDWALPVEVVGTDPLLDIALLRIPFLEGRISPLELAPEGSEPTPGEPAYAIGYPFGIGKTISAGIVSGVSRRVPLNTTSWLTSYIQTDAATSPGNSGGPLLDGCGRLLGIVTFTLAHPRAENIGFALPASTLREVAAQLRDHGRVSRPWHGIYGQMATPPAMLLLGAPPEAAFAATGFMVETVEPGSAADRAGIRGGTVPVMIGGAEMILGGDIITAVDGVPVTTLEQAKEMVRSLRIGQTVRVSLLRGGEPTEVEALLEERPILPQDLVRYALPEVLPNVWSR